MNEEAIAIISDFILLYGEEFNRIESKLQTIEETNIWNNPDELIEVLEQRMQLISSKHKINAVITLLLQFKNYLETGELPSIYVKNLETIQKLKEKKNHAEH